MKELGIEARAILHYLARNPMVKRRFEELLGPGAKARFKYEQSPFSQAIQIIRQTFPAGR